MDIELSVIVRAGATVIISRGKGRKAAIETTAKAVQDQAEKSTRRPAVLLFGLIR